MKKKEQFNLALWDRLRKNNIPHTFETRGGSKVEQVTKFDGNLLCPIAGVYMDSTETWRINGCYIETESESDLFIVWEEEQLMLDAKLYISVSGEFTLDYETAMMPSFNLIAIKKVSIPYTKGEGLSDG